jgi:hypothetical protein
MERKAPLPRWGRLFRCRWVSKKAWEQGLEARQRAGKGGGACPSAALRAGMRARRARIPHATATTNGHCQRQRRPGRRIRVGPSPPGPLSRTAAGGGGDGACDVRERGRLQPGIRPPGRFGRRCSPRGRGRGRQRIIKTRGGGVARRTARHEGRERSGTGEGWTCGRGHIAKFLKKMRIAGWSPERTESKRSSPPAARSGEPSAHPVAGVSGVSSPRRARRGSGPFNPARSPLAGRGGCR